MPATLASASPASTRPSKQATRSLQGTDSASSPSPSPDRRCRPTCTCRSCWTPTSAAPGLVPASLGAAWRAVSPDPTSLVGAACAAAPEARDELLTLRQAHVARAQVLYYDDPPAIVRGRGAYLYDERGRGYIDVVNNVAILGHSHPAVTAAATRQLRRLNTNSRFLYAGMARFADRLAALAPTGLDSVFLVNSGSESVDLAIRIARTVTGEKDLLCVQEAYHGWTVATAEISTSVVDNPGALDNLPPWIHPIESPNTYRGRFGADDPDAGRKYAASAAEAIARVQAARAWCRWRRRRGALRQRRWRRPAARLPGGPLPARPRRGRPLHRR